MSGIDTVKERDILDFRPNLARLIDKALLPNVFEDINGPGLGRETLSEQDKQDKNIQDY